MPDGNVQGIEVVGYAEEAICYVMHSFDSMGNASSMKARVEHDTWTFEGEAIRSTGTFRDRGKVYSGLWELRSGDGGA